MERRWSLQGIPEQITIRGGARLHGAVRAPPSKSHAHRVLVAASLCPEQSRIENASLCEDVRATIAAVEAYGTQVSIQEGSLAVVGVDRIGVPADVVFCGESASTMRFVTPILAHADGISVVTGLPSLRRRAMQPLLDAMRQLGVLCYSARSDGCAPLILFGRTYRGGCARILGDISSQFISGLLFSAPLGSEPTSIEVTTALESAPYVRMTLRILRSHGIEVSADRDLRRFTVNGSQSACARDHVVEGDYSSAAFMFAAAAVTGSEIEVSGLKMSGSLQGDSEVLSILGDMGVDLRVADESVRVQPGRLHATEIDASDYPDLVPPLAVIACYAQGTTKITNAERLRAKESNRLVALSSELGKMGAKIHETRDGLKITGVPFLNGAKLNCYGDHRVVMACAVAALAAKGSSVIDGATCVAKSYPNFFEDLKRLGGEVYSWE